MLDSATTTVGRDARGDGPKQMISPNRRKPIPSQVAKGRVFQFAEQVAAKLGLQRGDSLEPTVAGLGGKISYGTPAAGDNRAPESIIVRSFHDFTIYLPATTSLQRDRFTIAHELGHLLLHYPVVQKAYPGDWMIATRWVDMSDPVAQRAEWEANWFAAAFLMPGDEFRRDAEAMTDTMLAARYAVSEQAVEIRRRTVG